MLLMFAGALTENRSHVNQLMVGPRLRNIEILRETYGERFLSHCELAVLSNDFHELIFPVLMIESLLEHY